jgi:hypothetical protein
MYPLYKGVVGQWRSFRDKHKEELRVVYVTSREEARSKVTSDEVRAYYCQIAEVMSLIQSPKQILNMDESGVSSRPMKGKHKKVVACNSCTITPSFQDSRDIAQVSICSTIAFDGTSLPPMLVTCSKVDYKDQQLANLLGTFSQFETQKGYQTEQSMAFYINSILVPYCSKLREESQNSTLPVYLIMDNCSSHCTETILAMLRDITVIPIWLPPHASHFLQMLDIAIFSSFKRHYANLSTKKTTPRLEGKMIRVLHAWHLASWTLNIISGWREAGMEITRPMSDCKWQLNESKVTKIIAANCVDPVGP